MAWLTRSRSQISSSAGQKQRDEERHEPNHRPAKMKMARASRSRIVPVAADRRTSAASSFASVEVVGGVLRDPPVISNLALQSSRLGGTRSAQFPNWRQRSTGVDRATPLDGAEASERLRRPGVSRWCSRGRYSPANNGFPLTDRERPVVVSRVKRVRAQSLIRRKRHVAARLRVTCFRRVAEPQPVRRPRLRRQLR